MKMIDDMELDAVVGGISGDNKDGDPVMFLGNSGLPFDEISDVYRELKQDLMNKNNNK